MFHSAHSIPSMKLNRFIVEKEIVKKCSRMFITSEAPEERGEFASLKKV